MAIFPWVSNDPTYFKQLLDEVFCDIRNNQGRGKCYQPTRRPRLITLTEQRFQLLIKRTFITLNDLES